MATIQIRYVFMMLGFFGMLFTFALKVNLNLAIVSMVNHTAFKKEQNETKTKNETESLFHLVPLSGAIENEHKDGPFLWPLSLQGIIISSYFWGYLCGQIPGARLAEDCSAKWTFYSGVSVHIIGTLFTPPAAHLHYSLVIIIRALEGVIGGFTFPSMHFLLTKWAPPVERSIIASVIYNGGNIGTIASLLLTGTIAQYISWESAFYILGGMGLPWMIIWPILVSDNPLKNRFIKKEELTYLGNSMDLTVDRKSMKVPWKSIFSSGPVWVLTICHVTTGWGFYVVLTELPLYMKLVLDFKLDENGAVSSLPFFCMFLFSIFYGKLADYLLKKNKLSSIKVRKISTVVATSIPAACFVVLCFVESRVLAVALMCIAMTASGATYSGILQVHMELASNFAGTLMSITNTFASLTGITVPIFVGWLTEIDHSIASWRIIFGVTAGFYLLQMVVFVLFGKSEEQPWNKISSPVKEAE